MSKPISKFIFADEWVYLKIYAGIKVSELIVLDVLYPIIQRLENEFIIRKWFFIRYADPEFHIRLRLLMSNRDHLGYVLSTINSELKPYVFNFSVIDLQIGMYSRELERYGYKNIVFSESFFHYDSILVVEILRHIRAKKNNTYRWLFAIKVLDVFLDDLSIEVNLKFEIMNQLQVSFGNEFHQDKYLRKQVNRKYNNFKSEIDQILRLKECDIDGLEIIEQLIQNKSDKLRSDSCLKEFLNFPNGKFVSITKSYIHMTLNRFFLTKSRLNEFVVYSFLFRHYKSIIARQNNSK